MLDTAHLVAHSLPAARVHAGEPEPGRRTQPPGPPWPVGLNPLPRLPCPRRRRVERPSLCPASKTAWWRTHGLPPAVGTVPADTPPSTSPRSAVPAGTTSDALGRPKPSACGSSRLARATTASTGTFQRNDDGRVWYVARENGNRRASARQIPTPEPQGQRKPATGNFRGPTLVFWVQKEEEPCCRHDDRRRGGPSPVVMATRGCGFPPRHFASTPTPRPAGRPPPGVRRTFGPPLCSSCDASG